MRRLLVIAWLALVGLPLAMLAIEVLHDPSAWRIWLEGRRLTLLFQNTVLLVLGVWLLTVPLGTLAALVLYRSDLPLRRAVRGVLIFALFIPLPVLVSAWQAALGSGGWLQVPGWHTAAPNDPDVTSSGIAWKPWAHGLPAAIWVHACAALPWFIWLAGISLAHVERPVEEDALLSGGVWRALWHATLPRAAPALLAAAGWIGLQAANEITITDMMQVPTLAEEVYVQFARPDPPLPGEQGNVLARALAVSVPPALLLCAMLAIGWRRWAQRLPPLLEPAEEFTLIRLGRQRWGAFALMLVLLIVLLGAPVFSLIVRSGQAPPDNDWSVGRTAAGIGRAWAGQRVLMTKSLVSALVLGAATAIGTAWACWLVRERHGLRMVLFATGAVCACLPAPVLGIALKETILFLVHVESQLTGGSPGPVYHWLYSGPSVLPVEWATGLRLFPCALALIWPAMRNTPHTLFDQARIDGASPWHEWRLVAWPGMARAVGLVLFAVAALALGELGASKLVETPGCQTFAHEVFQQMHYGVDNHLAATCILMLALVAALAIGALLCRRIFRRM